MYHNYQPGRNVQNNYINDCLDDLMVIRKRKNGNINQLANRKRKQRSELMNGAKRIKHDINIINQTKKNKDEFCNIPSAIGSILYSHIIIDIQSYLHSDEILKTLMKLKSFCSVSCGAERLDFCYQCMEDTHISSGWIDKMKSWIYILPTNFNSPVSFVRGFDNISIYHRSYLYDISNICLLAENDRYCGLRDEAKYFGLDIVDLDTYLSDMTNTSVVIVVCFPYYFEKGDRFSNVKWICSSLSMVSKTFYKTIMNDHPVMNRIWSTKINQIDNRNSEFAYIKQYRMRMSTIMPMNKN